MFQAWWQWQPQLTTHIDLDPDLNDYNRDLN